MCVEGLDTSVQGRGKDRKEVSEGVRHGTCVYFDDPHDVLRFRIGLRLWTLIIGR